ncbi:bacterio-opsin activator domain-containing protein [Halogeometricum luteum]|uniref:Helix-turn-helix domain-containing protein n=1 Tax=Halogeometricum luteum TaxID=2950537 RepID=A0ABU2FYW5_9EURY|nr:helix-turn-helix domain-containing protein [Halogeometricum sp. S3BR5-2]MDS0293727.1 helix-turn-helix domain-containing protein [Halogeometricum sp. S3BR5-2]
MGAIATFELDGEAFALGRALAAVPSVRIDLERVVPVDGGVLPYVWVWGSGADEFGAVAAETEGIAEVRRVESFEDVTLYRLRWDPALDRFTAAILDADATVLEASGTAEGWRFELRFETRENLADFQTYCRERDIRATVTRVQSLRELEAETYGLTEAQRDALRVAYESGYFAEPRETTADELAGRFDVSGRAFSGRLRRGTQQLVGSTVVEKPGPGDRNADAADADGRTGP